MRSKFRFNKRISSIFLTGLVISGLIFFQVQQLEERNLKEKFETIATSYFILISNAWNYTLGSTRDFNIAIEKELLIEKNELIPDKEFSLLANMLPWGEKEALAVAWVPLVKDSNVKDYEEKVSKALKKSFRIHKTTHDEDKTVTTIHTHFPVRRNKIINSPDLEQGLDLALLPEFKEAFQKSIKADAPTVIHHLGDYDDGMKVFSIIHPVFKKHSKEAEQAEQLQKHLGFIIVDVDIVAIVENALRNYPAQGINIKLWGHHKTEPQLLYSHTSRLLDSQDSQDSELYFEKSFHFVDRDIKVRFGATSAFIDRNKISLSLPLFFISLLLTLIITLLFAYISERKFADARQRKLSTAVEQSGQAIVITNKDGVIEYINSAFTDTTGYSADEALGKNPNILSSFKQAPEFYENMWQTILSGKIWQGSITDKRKDGSFYPASLTISPIFDSHGQITHFVGAQDDLSAQKDLEEQLHQAQKLEAVGTLVGGVAHNFNNILAAIAGKAYLSKKDAKSSKSIEHLKGIEELSHRAADMINQLLLFSRDKHTEMQNIPFTTLMKATAKTANLGVPENISFKTDFTNEALVVHGNATQLQQVLLNLVNNARDSLEGSEQGEITVSLSSSRKSTCPNDDSCPICSEAVATLKVQDNGSGISQKNIPHIFEPFFTTKEPGKGTGLGLSTLYGTVESHGGIVRVESVAGQGTTFIVCLPIINAPSIEIEEEKEPCLATAGQGVLVVDDEDIICTTLDNILSGLGYKVFTASDGAKGVETYLKHKDDISLVITDIIMPNMNGYVAAEKIRADNPDMPVLFITGYDSATSEKKLNLNANTRVVTKPFQVADISHQINELLNP